MSIYSDLKEALQLIESVKDLKSSVEKLADIVAEMDRRLIRLEERFDGHAENVKVAAASAAASASHSTALGLHEKLKSFERRLDRAESQIPKLE